MRPCRRARRGPATRRRSRAQDFAKSLGPIQRAPSCGSTCRSSSGCGAGVNQLLGERIHAEVESLERPCSEEGEIAWLAKHDVICRRGSGDVDECGPTPAFQHTAVGLPKPPSFAALNAERFEHVRRKPGQLRARVDEHRVQRAPIAGASRILDLDIHPKRPHGIRHSMLRSNQSRTVPSHAISNQDLLQSAHCDDHSMMDPARIDLMRLGSRPVILDGGLATELERRGHDTTGPLWSARVLLDAPEAIEQLHYDYYAAGADCV